MGFNFPSTPTIGDLHPTPEIEGLPQYRWDGVAWVSNLLPGEVGADDVVVVPVGNVAATDAQDAIAELDSEKVAKAGDTMTGHLTLPTSPADGNAVRKDYVDAGDTALAAADTALTTAINGKVSKAGDTMTGFLTLHADPDAAMKAATKQYVDTQISSGGVPGSRTLTAGTGLTGGGDLSADRTFALDVPVSVANGGNGTTTGISAATQTALDAKVAKAGDTMTGDLTISKTGPIINLVKGAAGSPVINGMLVGSPNKKRWSLHLGNATSEAGSNSGSDYSLERYDDAGGFLGYAVTITRSTGLMTLTGDPTAALGAATKQYADLKVAKTGDTMSGGLTLNGGLNVTTDMSVYRSATPGTGLISFASTGGKYIFFDATSFNFTHPIVTVSVTCNSGGTFGGDVTIFRNAASATGLIFFGTTNTKYLYWDGATFNFTGGPIAASKVNTPTVDSTSAGLVLQTGGSTRMGIGADGAVVIGAPTGSATGLFVTGNANGYAADFRCSSGVGVSATIGWCVNTTYYGMTGAYIAGYFSFYGNIGAFLSAGVWATSDARLKAIQGDVDTAQALAAVNALPVKEYVPSSPAARGIFYGDDGTVPHDDNETLYGWVAQDVEQILPIAVRDVGIPKDDLVTRAALKRIAVPQRDSDEAAALAEEDATIKAINDRYMLTTLWAAVQNLSAQADALRAELDAMKGGGTRMM